MKCYDLFKLSFGNHLTLEAGAEGLGREINWIYYPESIPIEECPKYINGKELIIIFGTHLNGNYEILSDLIPSLSEKQIAGLLINLGPYIPSIPNSIKQLAELYKLPIFTFPWELKTVDITREICNTILSDEKAKDTETNFLSSLLFNNDLSHLDISKIISSSKFLSQKNSNIGVINYLPYHDSSNKPKKANNLLLISHFIFKTIEKYFSHYDISAIILQHNESVIFFTESKSIQKEFLQEVFRTIQTDIQKSYPDVFLYIGIGTTCGPYEIHQSYERALTSVNIAISHKTAITPYYYDQLGIWGILSEIKDYEILQSFYYRIFNSLIDYDSINNSNLLNTLKEYMKNDFNLQETADLLYIHKNTLKYRIEKIESILGRSLKSSDAISDIVIAFKIGQLLSL